MSDPRLLDKDWRLSHLYKIRDKNTNNIAFKRNRAQLHFAENKHTRNIILKSRQLGFTTDESIDTLDDTLFTRNFDSLFVAHEKQEASKIFDNKIDHAWKNVHKDIATLWKEDANNANTLKFDFGNGNTSSISVALSGRSGTYRRVHISEFAKMCKKSPLKAKEIITGTIPSVPLDGRVDIESTAEGEVGDFAEMFWEAWERQRQPYPTEFKAHFYNWTWDDEEIAKVKEAISFEQMDEGQKFKEYAEKHGLTDLQITYYHLKWLSLKRDWKALQQEYPTTPEEAFVSSGDKVFSAEVLEKMELKAGVAQGDWVYYADYNPMHRYALGADVAEGVARDSSTIVIWDFDSRDKNGYVRPEIVAEYKNNKIEPDQFAYHVKDGGNRYGQCLVAVERNNHGLTTLTTLKTIYPVSQIYKEIRKGTIDDKPTERLGWHTNVATKPKMLYEMNTALNQTLINIPSKGIVREFRTYDKSDVSRTTYSEEETYHWDRVVAACIGWQMNVYVDNPAYRTKQTDMVNRARANRNSAE